MAHISQDNTRVVADIVTKQPLLLANRGLRGACKALWGAWQATHEGHCAHHEYTAGTMVHPPCGQVNNALGIAISPIFTWAKVNVPQVNTDCSTKYKYILHVVDDGATCCPPITLFTYSVVILLRYRFEDVPYRYYTYTLTKMDYVRQLAVRWVSSLGVLSFDMATLLALIGGYNMTITTETSQYSYRINSKLNLCMHDRHTYPLSMVETWRLGLFMGSSTLNFLRAIPTPLRREV